jgi:hypothetical protein
MKRTINTVWMVLLAAIMVACCSCEPVSTGDDGDDGPAVVYNRYNIHYYLNKGKYYASYANYVEPLEHGFLPCNTKLEIGKYRGGFKVTAVDSGMAIGFQYKSGNMAGMSQEEYIALITSPTPVSYDHLSEVDQQGIKNGQVTNGMTKEGVMAAWGYPAKHQTPSTDDNTWVYWKDRFRTINVAFGADGKVMNVVR